MRILLSRAALLVLAAAALLAGCGGGDDDVADTITGASPGTTTPGAELPAAATGSVSGLIAFLQDLIANGTNDSATAVSLGDAVLPTDDTAEPTALQ